MRQLALVVAGTTLAVIAATSAAVAQDYEPPPPSAPPPPPMSFVMPDIQDDWMNWSKYDGSRFSSRLSLVPILDYNAFSQDDDSVAQVTKQKNQWDLRTFRIMLRGQLKFRALPVDYFVSLEVKGKDHVTGSEDSKIGWTDLYLSVKVPKVGKLFFGKIKEPWVYEMVGDAANLQQEERVLNPFFVSRNIGVRVQNTFAGGRASWAAGWFNDWWVEGQKYNESGNTFSGRLTALPYWRGDGAHYVHVGLSARHNGADDTMQFRGRPESNVSSYYVDTGALPATHASEVGLEGLWGNGPFFVTSEYVHAGVDSVQKGNPSFQGGYVTVSYVLTGEHRNYDRSVAYARRVMPTGRWGAWEIFTRYSHVDLDDRAIDGGIYDRGTLGLTWWATRHWRIGLDYGVTDLNRFGVHGLTQSVHPRLQWVY